MEFVKNRKGGDLLVHDGFTYRRDGHNGGKTYWVCSKYDTEYCRGRCISQDGLVTVTNKSHNHTVNPAEVEVRRRLAQMKAQALTTQDLPCQIITQTVTNASRSVAASLPSTALMTRTINKTRKANARAPANPTCLSDLHIPDTYTVTTSGEEFLLSNTGEADRILIFSTTANLRCLENSTQWHADGTFKSAPGIFTQLYTIHCVRNGSTFPCVFALLPNKAERTYDRLLENVKTLADERGINLNPEEIMSDFEVGFMNAFKRKFPRAQQKGCFFHFSQCLWRKIQQHSDIAHQYKTDDDFALNLRQLPALAFVPAPKLLDSFEKLMQTPFFVENENLLIPFTDYFEDVWVGRPQRSGRRPAMFAHDIWNTFESTSNGMRSRQLFKFYSHAMSLNLCNIVSTCIFLNRNCEDKQQRGGLE